MIKKFFTQLIGRVFSKPDQCDQDAMLALSRLDTENISVNEVKTILNVSTTFASQICETAVHQNLLTKNVNGNTFALVDTVDSDAELCKLQRQAWPHYEVE